jgi:hypothetical protein
MRAVADSLVAQSTHVGNSLDRSCAALAKTEEAIAELSRLNVEKAELHQALIEASKASLKRGLFLK